MKMRKISWCRLSMLCAVLLTFSMVQGQEYEVIDGFWHANTKRSKGELKKAAANGDANAMAWLGIKSLQEAKFDESEAWFKKGFELGDLTCGRGLFMLYRGTATSRKKSSDKRTLYVRSVNKKDPEKYREMALRLEQLDDWSSVAHYAYDLWDNKDPEEVMWYGKVAAIKTYNPNKDGGVLIGGHLNGIISDTSSIDKSKIKILLPYLIKSGEAGSPWYCDVVGDCYYRGYVVEENHREAVTWYQRAFDGGNYKAVSQLARCYFEGDGVTQNIPKAFEILEKADKQGFEMAKITLGDLYFAQGGDQNIRKAIGCWESIYNKYGEQLSRAERYRRIEQAHRFLFLGNRGIPAERLARCYDEGIGKGKDPKKALALYKEAFNLGNPNVGFDLLRLGDSDVQSILSSGSMTKNARAQILLGLVNMTKGETENAFKAWEQAQNLRSREAAHFLNVYKNGNATEDDYFRVGETYYELASMKIDGIGPKLKELAARGSQGATYWLTRYVVDFNQLEMMDGDPSKLLYDYAATGYAPALYFTGKACIEGKLGEEKKAEAASWYRKAAEKGNADAQNALGECLVNGTGGASVNYEEAIGWFKKAADQHLETAEQNLEYYQTCKKLHDLYQTVLQNVKNKKDDLNGAKEVAEFIKNHTNKKDYQLLKPVGAFTNLSEELRVMDGYFKVCDLLSFNPYQRRYWSKNTFIFTAYIFEGGRVEKDLQYLEEGIFECTQVNVPLLKEFCEHARLQLGLKRGLVKDKAEKDKAYVAEENRLLEERSRQYAASGSSSSYSSSSSSSSSSSAGKDPDKLEIERYEFANGEWESTKFAWNLKDSKFRDIKFKNSGVPKHGYVTTIDHKFYRANSTGKRYKTLEQAIAAEWIGLEYGLVRTIGLMD